MIRSSPGTDYAQALASTDLFGSLEPSVLTRLAGESEHVGQNGGSVLFYQGDRADCVYVVLSGRLRVTVEQRDGRERVVGEVARGEVVGEMALLTGEARSATVRAVRDSELLRLRKDAFDRVVEEHPAVMLPLTRRLATRLRSALGAGGRGVTSGRTTTLTLLPAGGDAPLERFAEQLTQALQMLGPVLHLTSRRVDELLGPDTAQTPHDHARDTELAVWLDEQEARHAFVIYQTDRQRSAWTVRCLRQADRILIVADAAENPEPGAVELAAERQVTDGPGVEKVLVLLHAKAKSVYRGTSDWLRRRDVSAHYHVVLDEPVHVRRLVRLLTGRAHALVLGGGGARSFAQIGVLRALDEAGFEIDVLGGTSMGAYLAAQRALGWDTRRILEFNKDLWTRVRPLKEYNLPLVSLVAGQRFLKATRALYGDAELEDLGLPFFCCSSNLTRARLMVHERGLAWRWLGASIAVPGVSPPLLDNGDVLMDGAVLDNLPIDVMRERHARGFIVGVDVSPVEDLAMDPDLRLCPPAWQILRNKLNPFSENLRVPSIFEILSRCASLGSVQQLHELKEQADLYLHPPTERFSMFDWDKIEELTEAGYRYASELLASEGGLPGDLAGGGQATGPLPVVR
jgi:NTE family protein/lysophospholipid hydrolase